MAHRARAADLLAEVGLHPGQEFLLAALWRHGPTPVGALARRLGVEQPTVTKMVRRMEAQGLMARGADAADRRRVVVRTTPQADGLRPALEGAWDRLEADTTAGLTAAETAMLHQLLGRVQASLTDDGSTPPS